MFKTASALLPLLATMALGPTRASGQDQSTSTADQAAETSAQTPLSTQDLLATVNGVPITEADVRFALSRGGHDKEIPSEHRNNLLEVIIRRELIYQRAVELGLDANAAYQEKLRQMEAQINAFKRKELSELFFRQEIAGKADATEAEARKYFADNAARIRTELHVWQILHRRETSIQQALNDLEHGTSFEEVAGGQFPKLPKMGRPPWDLGYLKWKQVPQAWQNVVYALEKGELSGVIRGPKNRFWIIKLIDRYENPDITFDSVRSTIIQDLKNARIEGSREQADRDLRAKANIVYSKSRAGASGG